MVDVLTGERLYRRAVETAADGTVAQVTATAPAGLPDAEVVDVAGRWLLPGLISCHTHLSVVFPFSATDEAENPAVTAYRSATRASEALRAGITTIRCVHEQNRADLLLRTAVRRGWFTAPRIIGAGRAISTRGGHGQGSACAYAAGEQEFYQAALAELAAGADHVKIFINGGLAGRAGVTLVNGTDYPPGDPVDGIPAAVHELLLMAGAGLSPLLSLQSVSVNAAALLGIGDRVGQIRLGNTADFVAVAADPLDDLAVRRAISLVVQGGRVVREDAR